jgi:catechol 2,3-dioxygenase-like lactoylglutathione lyase family enzyme
MNATGRQREPVMRVVLKTLSAALALAGIVASGPARSEPLGVERFGLSVAVDDLDRSAAFYEALFDAKPQVRSEGLVGFDIAGGLYALVSKHVYRLPLPPGGSVRPYVKVRDIDAVFARVKQLAPDRLESVAVTSEGPFHFFRFSDPEGNVIEFFSLGARR